MNIFRIKFLIVSIFLSFSLFSQVTIKTVEISEQKGEGQDAMVGNLGIKDKNYGTHTFLSVYKTSGDNPTIYRSFLEFDLTGIPSNAIIVDAELILTPKVVFVGRQFDYFIRRVENQWKSNEITGENEISEFLSDEIKVPFASISADRYKEHNVNVKDHVQNMVNYPYNNHGWKIALADEKLEGYCGVAFHSANHADVSKRPKLSISYVLPIEIDIEVSHCTAGSSDGSAEFSVSGGSGSYPQYVVYKLEEDFSSAKLKGKSIGIVLGPVTNNNSVVIDNLAPGLYRLRIKDALFPSVMRFKYHHFLIGREGEVTSCLIANTFQQTKIGVNLGANASTNDYANTAFGVSTTAIGAATSGTASYGGSNAYHISSLIDFNLDVDARLDIVVANLHMMPWAYYQDWTSSNETVYRAVTSDWDMYKVTWNSRPSISLEPQVILPKTPKPHGYSGGLDTINIKPLMEYWQTNPNYGLEIDLTNYEYPKSAQRTQRKIGLGSYFRFSFRVKSKLTPTFNETTNRGTIVVDAPEGELPYTYLINVKPIPSLGVIWDEIKGSIPILDSIPVTDSLTFFRGKINDKNFIFSGLKSGEYFVAVFDNNGQEILQQSIILTPEIRLSSSDNINLSEGVYSKGGVVEKDGKATLFYSFPKEESSGITFKLKDIDAGIFGFNYVASPSARSSSDFIFGIEVLNSSEYKVISFGTLQNTIYTVENNDEFRMGKENNDFVLYRNNVEVYRKDITSGLSSNLKMDILFREDVDFRPEYLWGRWESPVPFVDIRYPECGETRGDLSILYPPCNFREGGCVTDIVPTLNKIDGGEVQYLGTGMYADLPIGIYVLTLQWQTNANGYMQSHMTTEEISIGYIVDWTTTLNTEIEVNTINTLKAIDTDPSLPGYAFSTFKTEFDSDNWVEFKPVIVEPDLSSPGSSSISSIFYIGQFGLSDSYSQSYTGDRVKLSHLNFLGNNYLGHSIFSYVNGAGLSSHNFSFDNKYRMEQDLSGTRIYKSGESIAFKESTNQNSTDGAPLFIRAYLSGIIKYEKTISSFCHPNEIPIQFCQLKRKLEGGYYKVQPDGLLLVEYNEEYLSLDQKLNYIIKDYKGSVVMSTIPNPNSVKFGDNRITIDVVNLVYNTFYILEISNDKNETFYLRFKR